MGRHPLDATISAFLVMRQYHFFRGDYGGPACASDKRQLNNAKRICLDRIFHIHKRLLKVPNEWQPRNGLKAYFNEFDFHFLNMCLLRRSIL